MALESLYALMRVGGGRFTNTHWVPVLDWLFIMF